MLFTQSLSARFSVFTYCPLHVNTWSSFYYFALRIFRASILNLNGTSVYWDRNEYEPKPTKRFAVIITEVIVGCDGESVPLSP